jgi:23S rRNA (guanosine2251-2'-O)-methyltransferase
MIVYGRNPVREALRGPREVTRIWATEHARREPWLAPVPVRRAAPAEIEMRSGSEGHQGVCAQVSEFRYAEPDALLASPSALLVVLDQVQDPQNLGAICRSAECAGAAGVVIPERRAAEVTPAVCKASAGAVEHLPVARVRNIADFLIAVKRAGGWCYGAERAGQTPYDAVNFAEKVALVFGSEGRGLRPRVAAACDELICIPLHGRIESLSVGAAAAVLLFAAAAQRRRVGVPLPSDVQG